MSGSITRRQFARRSLGSALAGGTFLGLGDLSFLGRLRSVSAAESALDPAVVRLQPEIEPLVRLLEETPRERLVEEVAARIRKGTSYREVLAALLLAGVRNIQPRPSVGFKFHGVLVVNSAHIASLASPDEHRWLPIFWALDHFKSSQARDVSEGNWTMAPVKESAVPPAHGAGKAFVDAMERWDEEAADAAIAGLARTAGANEVFESFFRLGARDFRSIGHKAIYVSNAFRTLTCIGWQHAEPVLRSLAYALLMHEGDNPAERDGEPDRPWRRNLELVEKMCVHCQGGGESSAEAASDMLAVLRQGSDEDAARQVVKHLSAGVAAQSMWDAVFEAAGELIMRQPGIVALHAATTANALHYAYRTTASANTRGMLLLQAASFLPLFRGAAEGRGALASSNLEELEPLSIEEEKNPLGEVFAEVTSDRTAASRKALAYLKGGGDARALIDTARVLVFLKGDDAHDYKYSSAALEDYYNVSPVLRDRFLASTLHLLPGSGMRDNRLVERTREALA